MVLIQVLKMFWCLIFVLFAPLTCIYFFTHLVKSGQLSDHLHVFGNTCSFSCGLQNALVVLVPDCQFRFFPLHVLGLNVRSDCAIP